MAETSDKVSNLAARYAKITPDGLLSATASDELRSETAGHIRTMAASLLRQDETRGLRGFLKQVLGR